MDLYEILKVPFNAGKDQIKASFRKLSLLYHPDKARNAKEGAGGVDYLQILDAYKTLVDDKKREEYNKKRLEDLYKSEVGKSNQDSRQYVLPADRIEYSYSLQNILKEGIRLQKKQSFRVAEQDLVISVKPLELKLGATAVIEVVVKEKCPVCLGKSVTCYRCNGNGHVKKTEKVFFKIPSSAVNSEIIELDLGNYLPRPAVLSMKTRVYRVRIEYISN